MPKPDYSVSSSQTVLQAVMEEFQMASSVAARYPPLVGNAQIEARQAYDVIDRLYYTLVTWLDSTHKTVERETTVIHIPKTPWDFFKTEYFPEWLLKRFPANIERREIVTTEHHHYICPHTVRDKEAKHFYFMYDGLHGTDYGERDAERERLND